MLILLAFSGGLIYLTYSETISSSVASVATTTLLVLLTAFYALSTYGMVRETRRMAEETRKSREQEIRPVIEFHAREVYSQIANIGDGPARNVDLNLTLLPSGLTHTIREQSLPSGESISIPAEPFSSIRDRGFLELQEQGLDFDWDDVDDYEEFWEEQDFPYETLRMTGTVEDVWGNTHEVDVEYDVWNLTQELQGAVSLTLDMEQSLDSIARELRQIRKHLSSPTGTEDQL